MFGPIGAASWQQSWLWVLTDFHIFHSHSFHNCNTEEKPDSVTHNIYSQQGGAGSTAGRAVERQREATPGPPCTHTHTHILTHTETLPGRRHLHLIPTRSASFHNFMELVGIQHKASTYEDECEGRC